MAHLEVPGTLPAGRRDATPEPTGEAAASFSDRAAENWMPAAGSWRRSAETAARGRSWRSRFARPRRGRDLAPPEFAEAFAGSGLLVAPAVLGPALFGVEAEPSFESVRPRGSGRLSSPAVVDWRRGPGRTGRLRLEAARGIERSKCLLF